MRHKIGVQQKIKSQTEVRGQKRLAILALLQLHGNKVR